jgi:outer membrane immunogenic protein
MRRLACYHSCDFTEQSRGALMKNLFIGLTGLTLLITTPAVSADMRMPAKAPAPAAVPVAPISWTGCYVGAGGGYGVWKQRAQYFNDTGLFGVPSDHGGDGWFGTVQVGCDFQIGSNIVIGAFADYDFSSLKGNLAVLSGPVGEEKLKSSWAAGGRIGWLPFPQLLVFVSGGYTEARFGQVNFTNFDGSPLDLALARHTYSGWFLGTGYEYAIGWLPGLFWKTEYRFADYGFERVALFTPSTGALRVDSFDMDKHVHTVRSELVWRFNFGGRGVAARY